MCNSHSSKNFKCDTHWSSAIIAASTFAITSDDKQLVYYRAHQFARLSVSLTWHPALSASPTICNMLSTAHQKQVASQRAEKQRDSVHGQTLQHAVPPHRCKSRPSLDAECIRHLSVIQGPIRTFSLTRQPVIQSKIAREVLKLPQSALGLLGKHPIMHKTDSIIMKHWMSKNKHSTRNQQMPRYHQIQHTCGCEDHFMRFQLLSITTRRIALVRT